jgi:hypothetical protein
VHPGPHCFGRRPFGRIGSLRQLAIGATQLVAMIGVWYFVKRAIPRVGPPWFSLAWFPAIFGIAFWMEWHYGRLTSWRQLRSWKYWLT